MCANDRTASTAASRCRSAWFSLLSASKPEAEPWARPLRCSRSGLPLSAAAGSSSSSCKRNTQARVERRQGGGGWAGEGAATLAPALGLQHERQKAALGFGGGAPPS